MAPGSWAVGSGWGRPGAQRARIIKSVINAAVIKATRPLYHILQYHVLVRNITTPVWMDQIRPLIVSEIEIFERKEWKILSHDHMKAVEEDRRHEANK